MNTVDVPGHGYHLVQTLVGSEAAEQADSKVLPWVKHTVGREQYIVFKGSDLNANRDVAAMAVPAQFHSHVSSINWKTRYVSIELDRIDDPSAFVTNVRVVSKHDCQFTVDYTDRSGNAQRAIVWLKEPITWH